MKRAKPCCPACGRTITQPKPTQASVGLTRFWRQAYVTMAFGSPWPWVPGSLACEPAVMSTGVTSEPDMGVWEQAELAPCAPSYRRVRAEQREAVTGCDDRFPCALHRARAA